MGSYEAPTAGELPSSELRHAMVDVPGHPGMSMIASARPVPRFSLETWLNELATHIGRVACRNQ